MIKKLMLLLAFTLLWSANSFAAPSITEGEPEPAPSEVKKDYTVQEASEAAKDGNNNKISITFQ